MKYLLLICFFAFLNLGSDAEANSLLDNLSPSFRQ